MTCNATHQAYSSMTADARAKRMEFARQSTREDYELAYDGLCVPCPCCGYLQCVTHRTEDSDGLTDEDRFWFKK